MLTGEPIRITDADGVPHVYMVQPIKTGDALRLRGMFARVLGPLLVQTIVDFGEAAVGAMLAGGSDTKAAIIAKIAGLLRTHDGVRGLAGSTLTTIGHPELPDLVQGLLSTSIRDGQNLSESSVYDFAFRNDPNEPVEAAVRVAMYLGFFRMPGFLGAAVKSSTSDQSTGTPSPK